MFSANVILRHLGCLMNRGFGKLVRHWNANAIRRVRHFTVESRFHGIHYTEFITEIMFEIRNLDLGFIGLVSTYSYTNNITLLKYVYNILFINKHFKTYIHRSMQYTI